jgi:phosphoserine aminotransferase
MSRIYNFAAGPATIPLDVLETARNELTEYNTSGTSVMEMSHRSKAYLEIFERAKNSFNKAMGVPATFTTLFLQGGATLQFSAVPLNLAPEGSRAAYADTGNFAHAAIAESKRYVEPLIVADSSADNYTFIPNIKSNSIPHDAAYCYITTNNTVYGTRYAALPDTGSVPLVADMSSNILSESYDVSKFGVIFAGAQKNIGPAGLTVVIVRNDLLGKARSICPKIMNWKSMADGDSMLNTPPTYAIYIAGLCAEWLLRQGGVPAIEQINIEKARILYEAIDDSRLFSNPVRPDSRSRMNVVFKSSSPELDDQFVKEAAKAGLANLKGHRAVGGMRASIYNAMPIEGVRALVDFIKQFEVRAK